MSSDCEICGDTYNKTTRAPISCSFCEYKACRTCCKTWILSENHPRCMNVPCRKDWSRKFLVENFPKSFMTNEYKKHREKILLDEQRALLPATQPIVERQIEAEHITKEIEEINRQVRELNITTWRLSRQRQELTNNSSTNTRRAFVRACPDPDCRGFLSTQWKCGICEKWTCNKCHEIIGMNKETEHTCNPASIATAELLNNDTKSCPTCGTGIHKIEGCFSGNTPILMASGYVKIASDIKTGDYIMGDKGTSKKVLNTVQGDDVMYKIKQSNGDTYIVNSKHKLVLKCKTTSTIDWFNDIKSWRIIWFNRESMKMKQSNFAINDYNNDMNKAYVAASNFIARLDLGEPITITIEDYMKLDAGTKNNLIGYKTSDIRHKHQPVFLDPYLLGVWLGDGESEFPIIKTASHAIYKYIRNWAIENGASLETRGENEYGITCYGTNPFINMMALYKLTGNKHIPHQYLFNKREIRMRLLAGLIDTIGCVTNKNRIMLIFESNNALLQNICTLARSLGYTVTINNMARMHVRDEDNKKGYKQHCLINIDYKFIDELPTLDTLTSEHRAENIIDYTSKLEISSVGRGKYYGWMLEDGPLFLLPDFTVVHNCDQMFCTMCHTAFSWRTGRIETHIHNPHYYELMRRMGGNLQRNHNEVICGREINHTFMRTVMNEMNANRIPKNKIDYIVNICRVVTHNRYDVLPRYQVDHVLNHQDLRVAYLRKYIDEDEFKIRLQRMEKKTNVKREIYDILNVVQNAVTDILYRFHDKIINMENTYELSDTDTKVELNAIINEILQIQKYANECLRDVAKTYGVTPKHFYSDLQWSY